MNCQPILKGLLDMPEVQKAELVGGFRRKAETVGKLTFIASTTSPRKVLHWFATVPGIEQLICEEREVAVVRLRKGIQATLTIIPEAHFARELLVQTGSEAHLEQLQKLGPIVDLNSEALIYESLGLEYVPPELREGMAEVEAAKEKRLPKLVEEADLRGAFHCHTIESDGTNTIEELAEAAHKKGWQYIGIADHSKESALVNGLDEERVLKQIEHIRKINQSQEYNAHVFAGIECDILEDGRMDLADEVLAQLDYVIASVHRRYKLDRYAMTKRIIRAVENSYTTILGHVTGRILLRREPYEIDIEKIIDACIANGVIMELNAAPSRLDMDWRYWHKASEKGLKCSINPDAHSLGELHYVTAGINMARKGWLQKGDVINTMSYSDIQKQFNAKAQRR